MVRLEVKKIDDNRLRLDIHMDGEISAALSEYRDVEFEQILPLLDDLVIQIPRQFQKFGPDVDLLEKLKLRSQTFFQALFGDFGNMLIKLGDDENPVSLNILVDEEVSFIPFDILFTGEYFLWELFFISRQITIPSGDFSSRGTKTGTVKKFTLVGNPSDDADIEKSVRDELFQIAALWDDELDVSGPHFGKINNRLNLSEYLSSCHMFHFSGHYRKEKNGYGGWLLPDGSLYRAEDIRSLQKVPLFIFSNSCGDLISVDSGGFVREFLSRGVVCMLSTIGTVPTNQASYLGKMFYAALLDGNSASVALHRARQALIKKFGLSDLSWMFYTLFGQGDFKVKVSRKIAVRKHKRIILAGLAGLVIIATLLLIRSGMDRLSMRELKVTSSPSSLRVYVGDSMRGITPATCTVSALDEIRLVATGFDTARYHLKKIDGEWIARSPDAPQYILTRNRLEPAESAEPGKLHVNLVPDTLNRITFTKMKGSLLMVQGFPRKITGERVSIEADSVPHRFIIEQGDDVFDMTITVRQDTVIDVRKISDSWNRNRFQ